MIGFSHTRVHLIFLFTQGVYKNIFEKFFIHYQCWFSPILSGSWVNLTLINTSFLFSFQRTCYAFFGDAKIDLFRSNTRFFFVLCSTPSVCCWSIACWLWDISCVYNLNLENEKKIWNVSIYRSDWIATSIYGFGVWEVDSHRFWFIVQCYYIILYKEAI